MYLAYCFPPGNPLRRRKPANQKIQALWAEGSFHAMDTYVKNNIDQVQEKDIRSETECFLSRIKISVT